jgi:hypothetical protein
LLYIYTKFDNIPLLLAIQHNAQWPKLIIISSMALKIDHNFIIISSITVPACGKRCRLELSPSMIGGRESA